MEINRIDIGKPQEIVWSSTSDGQELGQAVRSFRCTFCKRGFSNAQALGGHMNVHRKDRARLKGSLDETLFSMDVMKKSPSDDHPPASPDDHNLLQPESSDDHDKNCTHKRPWIFSEEAEESPRRKDGFKEVLQLPLFVEASSSTNDLGTSSCADGHVEKSIQLRQPASSISEVDLELRLGPEPKD